MVYFVDFEQSIGLDFEVFIEWIFCFFDIYIDLGFGVVGFVFVVLFFMEEIQVELQCVDFWKRFYDIGIEMIIIKVGR